MNYPKIIAPLILLSTLHAHDKSLVTNRVADYPINPIILHRWAPRALSQEPIGDTELMTLFEAARWGQSSYNNQPWRFIYARRESAAWSSFVNLLVPANQAWAGNAQLLVVVISKKSFDHNGEFDRTHSFATGTAVQNMALQAASMGIVVHGMAGFDYERACTELGIPDEFEVEAMLAIGKLGDKSRLPEALQAWEQPSDRKPLHDVLFQHRYSN